MAATATLLSSAHVAPPPGGRAETLRTADGVRLRLGLWAEGARGLVLLAPGRTEFVEKHYETVERLQARGFAVAVIDWRGQGLSDRLLPDRRRGHVDRFSAFQADLDAARARLAPDFADRPWILMGHSMGGCVSARALMRQDARETAGAPAFRAALLSAPMLRLYGPRAFYRAARLASELICAFGRGGRYVVGGGAQTLGELGFEDNVLTRDPERFERFREISAAHDPLVIASATWGWLRAALREMPRLKPSATPTFVGIGLEDKVVAVEAARDYAAARPANRFLGLAGARHEPLMEVDETQDLFWSGVDAFLAEQGL